MAITGLDLARTGSKFRNTFTPMKSRFSTMSDADRELLPYIDQVKQEKHKEATKIQPLKMVFDLLQRGQYLSANIVDEIVRSTKEDTPFNEAMVNTLQAAWEGITGERKGSYGDIFEEHTEWGKEKVFKGREGKIGGEMTYGDILGFLGDVFLDPTTYMGVGATKAAKAVAGDFAQDVLRVTAAEMGRNVDQLGKLAAKGFDLSTFNKLFAQNADDAVKYLGKFGDDAARQFNKVYKEATKQALRKPAKELREDLLLRIDDIVKKDYSQLRQKAMKGGAKWDEAISIAQQAQRFDPTAIQKLGQQIPEKYASAGERAFRFMGKEYGASVRDPNIIERSWNLLGDYIQKTKGAQKIDNAWWSLMNRSPIGKIKKAFGIRNPYEKMVRFEELKQGEEFLVSQINRNVEKTLRITSGYDKELKNKFVELNDIAEVMYKSKKHAGTITADLLDDPKILKKMNITPEERVALKELNKQVRGLLSGWRNEFLGWRKEGIMTRDMNELVNYLPTWFKDPSVNFKRAAKEISSGAPREAMRRGYTRKASAKQQIEKYKWIFGIDDVMAEKLVKKHNVSGFSMDLDELLMLRSFSQAKMAKRANIIRTFKEFGVPVEDAQKYVKQAITRPGANLKELGLVPIQDKAFEGLLFDREVAGVLGRAAKMTDPKEITSLQQIFRPFTAWWKRMVTMTTGFHARNHYSNYITGTMVLGPRFLDVRKSTDALAGVAYALKKADPKTMLKETGMNETVYTRTLNKRIGGKTIKEWADIARESGVISEATHGFDVQSAIQKLTKDKKNLNVFSPNFVGSDISYKIGSYVENTPKFQMFLMNIDDMTKKGFKEADLPGIITYAQKESKKWFIDYNDLCFDTETEILTDDGWQNINTISYDQEALTFNLEKDCLEWKPISYIHKAGYNGNMYYLENKSFNAAVTPKHKWVKIGGDQGGVPQKPKYTLKETQEIFGTNKKLKLSGKIRGNENKYFTDEFVELLGWAITEGSYSTNSNGVYIYQSKKHNPKHCQRIEVLAKTFMGNNTVSVYKEKGKTDIMTVYVGGPAAGQIKSWAPNKTLTMKFIKRLTYNQLVLLYETIINADGHKKKYSSGGEHCSFTQKNKTTTDNFQALCMMIGKRAKIRKTLTFYQTGVRKEEVATEVNSISVAIKKYSGKIWCIHTDNNTVVARRKGTTYISGNTEFEKNTMKEIIPFYCVPVDCEILTKEGWKTYDNLTIGEPCLAYDAKQKKAFWHTLKGVATFDYDGVLMNIEKYGKKISFTPDHKWPLTNGKVVKGYELKYTHSIPTYPEKTEWPEHSEISERQAKIIGWLLTDGYMRTKGNHTEYMIYQKKEPYLSEIKKLLKDYTETVHPDTGTHCLRFKGNEFYNIIRNKENPFKLIGLLNKTTAEHLWATMYKGDGTTIKERKDRPGQLTNLFFAAENKEIRDFFQALSIMLGKKAGASDRGVYLGKRHLQIRGALSHEWYKGKIWCPELDNNCWLMRRNGVAVFTHNTWLRRNISNQISAVLMYPEMVSIFPKLHDAFTYDDPNYDPKILPDWLKQLEAFPVGKTSEGEIAMFNPNFPYQDFNKIPISWDEGAIFPRPDWKEVKDDVINAVHPLIKTAMSMMTEKGYDFFYKQDLEDTRRAPYVLRLMASNPRVLGLLDGIARAAGRDDGIKAKIDEKGKLKIDGKLAKLMEDNLPILRHIDYLFYGTEVLIPGFDEALAEMTNAVSDYEGWEKFFQVLSFYGGIKLKPIDLQKAKEQVARDTYWRAKDRQAEERKEKPEYQARRVQSRTAHDQKVRRLVL